jgi:hypothetical protein
MSSVADVVPEAALTVVVRLEFVDVPLQVDRLTLTVKLPLDAYGRVITTLELPSVLPV